MLSVAKLKLAEPISELDIGKGFVIMLRAAGPRSVPLAKGQDK